MRAIVILQAMLIAVLLAAGLFWRASPQGTVSITPAMPPARFSRQASAPLAPLAISESLALWNNPWDTNEVRSLFRQVDKWSAMLDTESVGSALVQAIRGGNFFVRSVLALNCRVHLVHIEVGYLPDLREIPCELDSSARDAVQHMFTPLDIPKFSHHLLVVLSSRDSIAGPPIFVVQSYTDLHPEVIPSGDCTDTLARFYFEVNQSSLGGGLAYRALEVYDVGRAGARKVFERPVLLWSRAPLEPGERPFHCMYEVQRDTLTMLRMFDDSTDVVLERYRFENGRYVLFRNQTDPAGLLDRR